MQAKQYRGILTFKCHDDFVSCLSLSKDNSYALSGSFDGTVKLLDLSKGEILHTFHHSAPVKALVFSEDKGRITTFSD
jgi:WD40 repeat protein